MTGLPTVTAHLDDGTGSFPYDVSQYVRLAAGVKGRVGRGDEFDEADAGELEVTLEAQDGRFMIGSVQYGCFVDQKLRVRITKGSTTRSYIGAIAGWPAKWASALGNLLVSAVSGVDDQARLTRTKISDAIASEIRGAAPGQVGYWPLDEESGSTAFAERSGGGAVGPLNIVGPASAVTAAGAPGPIDGVNVAAFDGTGYLQGPTPTVPATGPKAAVLGLFFSTTVSQIRALAQVGDVVVALFPSAVFFPTPVLSDGVARTDGQIHLAAVAFDDDGTTVSYRVWVDGAVVASASVPSGTTMSIAGPLRVGGTAASAVSNVFYATRAAAAAVEAKIPAIWAASGVGETVTTRLNRIAGYAGTSINYVGTPPSTIVAKDSLVDVSHWDALNQTAGVDGGVLHIRGSDNQPRYVTRAQLRSNANTPAVTISAKYIDPGSFSIPTDKSYVKNLGSAAGQSGAAQVVRDETSIDLFGEYTADYSDLPIVADDDALARAQWVVNRYATPRPRVPALSVDAHTIPNGLAEQILSLQPGASVRVSDLPPTYPTGSVDMIVEGLSDEITDDSWRVEFNLSPAEPHRVWVTEDPVFGAPDIYPATF